VLVIGFGRFGQIASQPLLLRGIDVSIIDNDVEMIQAASEFGFKVYYGDGKRLDILHAPAPGTPARCWSASTRRRTRSVSSST
jgi:glutathione-regulated potassium-efflux system protein KefB